MGKIKAIVVFLLLTGIVIAAMIMSYNLSVGKSKAKSATVSFDKMAKPTTASSQIALPQQQLSQDRMREIKLQQRLQEIERDIAKRKYEIEQVYNRKRLEITQEAQEQMAQLDEAEEAAKRTMHGYTYNDGYFDGRIDNFGNVDGYYHGGGSTSLVSEYDLGKKWLINKKKTELAENFQDDITRLNRQIQNELTELDRLKERWIAGAVANSQKPEFTNGKADRETPSGFITGILYSDRPSVLIGSEILHEGDNIQEVKVVKINSHTVELEKNGNRWTQKAGETLSSYWGEPNQ